MNAHDWMLNFRRENSRADAEFGIEWTDDLADAYAQHRTAELEAQVARLKEALERAEIGLESAGLYHSAQEARKVRLSSPGPSLARIRAEALREAAHAVEREVMQRDNLPPSGDFFVSTKRLRARADELEGKR